jgi:type II secretory pathway pseudopilin PulG
MCATTESVRRGRTVRFRRRKGGFSLVEVTIAIGITVVAILSVIGLLSVGIRSNRISVEETRASTLLTLVEADLRNTLAGSGTSALFGLPLPYGTNASGGVMVNPVLAAGSFATTGLNEAGEPVAVTASPRPRYQIWVAYTRIPATNSLLPLEARVIVNWPATNAANPAALNTAGSSSMVEGLVTFPLP